MHPYEAKERLSRLISQMHRGQLLPEFVIDMEDDETIKLRNALTRATPFCIHPDHEDRVFALGISTAGVQYLVREKVDTMTLVNIARCPVLMRIKYEPQERRTTP